MPDADGALWIGTYGGGLNRFKDGKFVPILPKHGLFEEVVSRIFDDGRGNLWMMGLRGVFRASRQELNDFADGRAREITCVSYGAADGMPASETNGGAQPAGWQTRDGRLWFPTIKGVAIFDPREPDAPPPPVFIESVTLDQEQAQPGGAVIVDADKDRVEIQYTAVSFSRPEQAKFKYQLVGLDNDWQYVGARRTAYFSHLPPGDYTFRVLAANADGVWNNTGASLKLTVKAPFWRRWWFLLLCAVGGLALVFGGFRARVKQLERRQAAQQLFARQLLESQEAERKRIAIELHDGLGQSLVIIKNRALLSLARPDDHERALTQIEEISEAASSALIEIREIASSLRPYQIDRFGLVNALEEMIAHLAGSSEIMFSREIDAIDRHLSKEAQINLYRIVQESLNNIVKHAEATEGRISLKEEAGVLRLLIQDNGKGFTESAIATGKRGLGLTGIAERAKVLGGRLKIHSVPGQGTTVNLDLQLQELENEN